jgi:ribosomal protein S18 acetylase RimI-like enzyme
MKLDHAIDFDHDGRQDLYTYVEANGAVAPPELRSALKMDPREFGHHVAILKRDGVLEEREGTLRIALDDEVEEEFSEDGIDYTIRQARQEDLSGLVGAIRQAIGGKTYVDAESVADVVDNEGVLLRHNELELRVFFVACVHGEVVGWVHLKRPELDKLSHTAELTLGVLEEYREHGIGSQLLARGLEWAQAEGCERIYNSIPSKNQDAIDFLESQGWETEAVRQDHYKRNGEYHDEVMMAITM